jgi:regulator of cell morphogenesis and NO signaling
MPPDWRPWKLHKKKEFSMNRIDTNCSVGALVREKPSRSRVFDRFEIDFCCGGKVSLEQACTKHGVPLEQIVAELESEDAQSTSSTLVDADAMTLSELCDHIEATHHAYLRQELPRLDEMTAKVARVHGDKEPKLLEIRAAFVELEAELMPHMMKEEQILFPIIRKLEASTARPEFHCGSVSNPIRRMENEHDHAGDTLKRLRQLTNDYTPPGWACNTYRALFDGLRELEENMHQHVHKENNVLFVKAAELEACLEVS